MANGSDVVEMGYIDITNGSVVIYPDHYIQNNKTTRYSGKNFTITGTTTANTVEIAGDKNNTYDINILDLSIQVNSIDKTCAFNISEGANVNLKLLGTNVLKSGNHCAGLQKSSKDGTLTIDGTGSLTANGGMYSAGIGGGETSASVASCTNIIINGGTITAKGGSLGTGIGAGYFGSAIVDNIQINGGIVDLGRNGAAGIGTSRTGTSVSNIKITGGKVIASSWGECPGIGGANLSDVEISGGTMEISTGISSTCPAIGVKNSTSTVKGIYIIGGNVYLHADKGSVLIGTTSMAVAPTDKDDEEVLETILTLSGVNSELSITNIEFEDYSGTYGLKDMYTRSNGKVYLYLPSGAKVVSITAGGSTYTTATPITAGTTGTLTK